MKKIFISILFLMFSFNVFSQITENYFKEIFAEEIKGEFNVKLTDNSKIDIVTDTFAIEVVFAKKWSEGVGKSLYNSFLLDKKPGILILINDEEDDQEYLDKLNLVCKRENISEWIMYIRTQKYKRCDI